MKGAKTETAKVGMQLALAHDREIAHNTPKNIMPNIPGAYLRYKRRGIRFYFFLVKSYWQNGHSWQKVLRYYGTTPPRQGGKL